MNLRDANFEDLVRTYYYGTRAHGAATHLRHEIEARHHLQLANLLRDYRERAVKSPREIELRAAVDDLLICYDVLEIAATAGLIEARDQPGFWSEARLILSDKHVRRYYAGFYRQRLPQLLRYRLAGRHSAVQNGGGATAGLILQFLALDGRFMTTLNDGHLLRMLDSFTIAGWRFRDVVELMRDPEEYIRRILLPPEKRDVPDLALYEFSLFLEFSIDLDSLLARFADHPLLQSEIWSHYSYWFEILGPKLKRSLGRALSQLLQWQPRSDTQAAAREIQQYVTGARQVLERLTSPSFAQASDRLLGELGTGESVSTD